MPGVVGAGGIEEWGLGPLAGSIEGLEAGGVSVNDGSFPSFELLGIP